jgi:hypothetical protein
MKKTIQILAIVVGALSGLSALFFATLPDWGILLSAGGGLTLAFALGAVT